MTVYPLPTAITILATASGNRTGGAVDLRDFPNYGLLGWRCSGNSAIAELQAAPDDTGYATFLTITATVGQTGVAAVSAWYPYVRAIARSVYSAAGGSAQISFNYTPGRKIS